MTFYNFARGLVSIVFGAMFRIKIQGKEHIPTKGRIVICSNHVSLLDPIIVAIAVPRQVFFMAKKELFRSKLLGTVIRKLGAFPVDREGADLLAVRSSLKILKNEQALGIFPEGTRIKEHDISNAKPGIAMMSIKGKASIIPIHIDTQYKVFREVKVTIGEAVCLEEYFDKKLSIEEYTEISKKVMNKIYDLKRTEK
ncbi:lysophospholipid acyltransferase family protein [Brassicibacter mesophilus]|uniref:lysophospholipid acyltransferase family protein n=1 Tax=Brassicibacter mesophilus TaxID=745119 RepID=UPI003D2583DE